jgi:hypothetical protein
MEDYICEDRIIISDLAKRIQAMTEEEYDEYLKTLEKKEKNYA